MRNTAPIIFVLCLAFGMWMNAHSWNGQVFVYVGEQRSPAAVRTLQEYSALDRRSLYRSAEAQLLAYAEFLRDDENLGIRLGHPLLSVDNGGKEFGCQVQDHSGAYDRLEVTFVATGISEGGELPHMTVDSRCHSENDLNRLEPVWIPLKAIVQNHVKDGDLELGDDNMSRLHFENMPDTWPENWVMWSVKLYREDGSTQPLTIDSNQMRRIEPKLLSFEWKAQ